MRAQGDAKANISAERASQIAFDQLELVLRSMKEIEWARPGIAIALALTFSSWIAWPRLAFWIGLVIVGGIPASLTDRRFLARSAFDARSAPQWQRLFCLSHASYAVTWTSLAYFLRLPGNDLNHCMIVMALGCTVSSVVPLFGPCRPLSLTLFAIIGSGFLGAALSGGNPAYHTLALAIAGYLALLFFILRQVHAAATNTLLLRYENCDLLVEQRSLIESKNGLIETKNSLIRDLANARQMAEQRRAEAEEANKSKSRFLANMSHELRTPMNAIIGFAEIIKSRILGDDINRDIEYAGLIHRSGMHLLALINDVLDLAKIEAGSFMLTEREVTLGAVIAEAATLLQHRAQEGDCTLICASDPGLSAVRADERALKQIFFNLLSNAIKFTLPGGTVTAFARQEADERVAFGVADTGVGIAPEDQAKVFEQFGQARHAHVPKEKGTGLGLSIVQGLVHAHGGQITLESLEQKGTTVTVTLPAYRTISAQRRLQRSGHHI